MMQGGETGLLPQPGVGDADRHSVATLVHLRMMAPLYDASHTQGGRER